MLYNDAFDRATMNILTSFPFTFKLAVPGLSNPFTSLSTSPTTGTNPPTAPQGKPHSASQPSFSDRPSRPITQPTRPLPSFSPSPSPTPSTSVSFTHSYSHLAPKSHLAAPQQWHPQSQFLRTPQSHSPSPAPLSRKRGWKPSYTSPSESQAMLACSNGYLDTPAKYRDMADKMEVMDIDQMDGMRELDEDDLPPTKRRRGIAGSIVSTAWSAALIGTAVSMSIYRLWRDRGRHPDDNRNGDDTYNDASQQKRRTNTMSIHSTPEPSSPPPPYNHEWTAVDYPRSAAWHQQITPPRMRDKGKGKIPKSARKVAATVRTHPRRQKVPVVMLSRPGASRVPVVVNHHPEFDFGLAAGSNAGNGNDRQHAGSSATGNTSGHGGDIDVDADVDEEDVDDQMDWIGGKLAQLIEEGKKALGKEVVVMSDAKEDEVDDGSGAWVSDEEGDGKLNASMKRRGSSASTRYHTGDSLRRSVAPPISVPLASTPPRRTHARELSYDTGVGSPGFGGARLEEDSTACESPEVREMMERARAKLAGRALGR